MILRLILLQVLLWQTLSGTEIEESQHLLILPNGDNLMLYDPPVRTGLFEQKSEKVVLIHGTAENSTKIWYKNLTSAYLNQKNKLYQMIEIDWSNHQWHNRSDIAKNIRSIGEKIGLFLLNLATVENFKVGDYHLVAHSIGCHVAGSAGKYIFEKLGRQVGRITALDAANSVYTGKNYDYRLKKGNAKIVVAIHTDSYGTGIGDPFGDVDLFPNGGNHQPGCYADVWHYFLDFCSHHRSYELWTEAVSKNVFLGTRCKSWEDFENGSCKYNKTLNFLGKIKKEDFGIYFTKTNGERPFLNYIPSAGKRRRKPNMKKNADSNEYDGSGYMNNSKVNENLEDPRKREEKSEIESVTKKITDSSENRQEIEWKNSNKFDDIEITIDREDDGKQTDKTSNHQEGNKQIKHNETGEINVKHPEEGSTSDNSSESYSESDEDESRSTTNEAETNEHHSSSEGENNMEDRKTSSVELNGDNRENNVANRRRKSKSREKNKTPSAKDKSDSNKGGFIIPRLNNLRQLSIDPRKIIAQNVVNVNETVKKIVNRVTDRMKQGKSYIDILGNKIENWKKTATINSKKTSDVSPKDKHSKRSDKKRGNHNDHNNLGTNKNKTKRVSDTNLKTSKGMSTLSIGYPGSNLRANFVVGWAFILGKNKNKIYEKIPTKHINNISTPPPKKKSKNKRMKGGKKTPDIRDSKKGRTDKLKSKGVRKEETERLNPTKGYEIETNTSNSSMDIEIETDGDNNKNISKGDSNENSSDKGDKDRFKSRRIGNDELVKFNYTIDTKTDNRELTTDEDKNNNLSESDSSENRNETSENENSSQKTEEPESSESSEDSNDGSRQESSSDDSNASESTDDSDEEILVPTSPTDDTNKKEITGKQEQDESPNTKIVWDVRKKADEVMIETDETGTGETKQEVKNKSSERQNIPHKNSVREKNKSDRRKDEVVSSSSESSSSQSGSSESSNSVSGSSESGSSASGSSASGSSESSSEESKEDQTLNSNFSSITGGEDKILKENITSNETTLRHEKIPEEDSKEITTTVNKTNNANENYEPTETNTLITTDNSSIINSENQPKKDVLISYDENRADTEIEINTDEDELPHLKTGEMFENRTDGKEPGSNTNDSFVGNTEESSTSTYATEENSPVPDIHDSKLKQGEIETIDHKNSGFNEISTLEDSNKGKKIKIEFNKTEDIIVHTTDKNETTTKHEEQVHNPKKIMSANDKDENKNTLFYILMKIHAAQKNPMKIYFEETPHGEKVIRRILLDSNDLKKLQDNQEVKYLIKNVQLMVNKDGRHINKAEEAKKRGKNSIPILILKSNGGVGDYKFLNIPEQLEERHNKKKLLMDLSAKKDENVTCNNTQSTHDHMKIHESENINKKNKNRETLDISDIEKNKPDTEKKENEDNEIMRKNESTPVVLDISQQESQDNISVSTEQLGSSMEKNVHKRKTEKTKKIIRKKV